MSESKESGNFFWKRPHINKVDALQCWKTETMTTDLTLLALAVVLGLIHIVLASHAASWQRGYRWAASARKVELPPLTGVAGRFARALGNFGETFPLFAAALLVAHISGKTGVLTLWGAGLYLGARVAYLPLYAAGIYLIRSLVWNVSALGIFLVLLALWW
jgi:uncharacterized MAPEG superfamily protein